jgi:ABC-2 type transport system ATP-binding protein
MWSLLEAERRDRNVTVLFSTHYLAEAESCDRVIMLARGETVAADTPPALMAGVGDQVVEVEGADAEQAARALHDIADVRLSIRTERGYRLAVGGTFQGLDALVRAAPRLTRLDVRRATLEDVYFARTRIADPGPGALRSGGSSAAPKAAGRAV